MARRAQAQGNRTIKTKECIGGRQALFCSDNSNNEAPSSLITTSMLGAGRPQGDRAIPGPPAGRTQGSHSREPLGMAGFMAGLVGGWVRWLVWVLETQLKEPPMRVLEDRAIPPQHDAGAGVHLMAAEIQCCISIQPCAAARMAAGCSQAMHGTHSGGTHRAAGMHSQAGLDFGDTSTAEGAGRTQGVCALDKSPVAGSQDHPNTGCCGLAAVWPLREELGLQCSSVWATFSCLCELLHFLNAEILNCTKQLLSWAF